MSMVNLDSYIDSRRIKFIYRITNEPIENWNAIGKYWLSRLDLKFNETLFLQMLKCFNLKFKQLSLVFIKNHSKHGHNFYNV
jgi:hypothetical protein